MKLLPFTRCLCGFGLYLFIAACAEVPRKEPAPVDTGPFIAPLIQEDAQLIEAVTAYRSLPAAELGTELERLRRVWLQQRNEENRLRLAGFYALVPPPHGDRSKALALLDVPPNALNGRGRNHPLAVLLIPLLQDVRRGDDNLAATQLKLRDETRRADTLQQGNDILQKKLDDIRALEQKMLDREKTRRKP